MRFSLFRSYLIGFLAAVLLFTASTSQAAQNVSQDVKVAVLPFTINAGEDLAYLQDSLPELIADRLGEAGFQVVNSDVVDKLIADKGITSIDSGVAKELALQSGAAFSIYGDLNQIGENLSLDARLIDAYSDDPAKKISVTKEGLINLLPAVDALVERMRMDLLRLDVIGEVDVEGTKVLDKDVVLMRLTLQKGDLLTAKTVNTALKNIYDLGYFDDVRVKVTPADEGKRVTFVVEEKPRILAVGVTGADNIDSEDIVEAMSTKKGGVVNPKVLAEDIRVIREMYRKDGYYKAKVTHEIEDAGNGTARLTLIVDEGRKLYIEEVVIDGAEQVDPDDVKDVLALQERGMFSFITDTGVLKEELLERDTSAIQAFYQSKGFLNIKVGRPEVEIKEDGITVIYRVWEGDRYKMGATTFKGDLIEDTSKLLEVVSIDELQTEDEYFDRSVIQGDVAKLTSYYNDYGYAYADVKVHLQDDAATKSVGVVYTISKHQRVHIRRVLIEGNTRTRDNVILREMRLADGDLFSGKKLKRSYARLGNLNYFEKVDITPAPTGNPEEMDLIVKVKDKPTGNIGGGIGYSTYENVYIGGNITETNLFGKGYHLALNASFSGVSTKYALTFRNPHINDTDVGFTAEIHNREDEYNRYDKDSTGGSINFSYPIGEYTNLSWGYLAESYTIKNVDSEASDDVKEDEGSHFLSQLNGRFVRDTRDSNRATRTGTRTALTVLYGGGAIGGTDNFVKYMGEYNWWTPVFEEVVFHSKFWAGFVHKNFNGDEIPTDQRFDLGGIGDVRGYSRDKITPLDSYGDELGGTKAFYTNLELTRVINKEYGISGLVFFDAGNVWKEEETMFSSPTRHGESPVGGLYKSVGAGINWYSPMGPLALVYGYGLDQIGSSGRHKFEFTMGQQF